MKKPMLSSTNQLMFQKTLDKTIVDQILHNSGNYRGMVFGRHFEGLESKPLSRTEQS